MEADEINYTRKMLRDISTSKIAITMFWTKYRSNKQKFYELLNDPKYLSGHGKGNVALLVIFLVAVYFLDLLFGWQVAEFMARQAFHEISLAMYLATLLFPLAYVVIEVLANYYTHMAKRNADYFDRDKGKRWVWIAFVCLSVTLATVMPVAYVATGIAGMAKSGNIVFVILLCGLTLLTFLVHLMMIFSGDYMVAAKERLLLMLDYERRKGNMDKGFYKLMQASGALQSLERDYQVFCEQSGQVQHWDRPSLLVMYIEIYIARDYHHLPYGEEPPMSNDFPNGGLLRAG
jgi:hypothetical protein